MKCGGITGTSCDNEVSGEDHPCPFEMAIGDPDRTCACCDDCENDCELSI